jgi:hypothetical protein
LPYCPSALKSPPHILRGHVTLFHCLFHIIFDYSAESFLLLVRSILNPCFAGEKQAEYDVSFLPPLVLNFELPVDYPTASSPVFTLSSKWLTRTQVRLFPITVQTGHLPVDILRVSHVLTSSASVCSVVELKSYGNVYNFRFLNILYYRSDLSVFVSQNLVNYSLIILLLS